MADLSVKMAGVAFKNPIIPASGVFGFGREYEQLYPLSRLGGISTKGTTLLPRDGNDAPRIAETKAGMLNSVGLQNPGVDAFLKEELPHLLESDIAVIANIAGSSLSDYVSIAQKLEGSGVHMIELNFSCPNVKEGCVTIGVDPEMAAKVTAEVRKVSTKPLMVKLSPNVTDIVCIAEAVEAAGADAISLINTLLGMRIDIHSRRPILKNNTGGLSGPAVFPVALRMVWQVASRVKIPVCGMGGISTWQDAIEMMMAGATTLQIGAAIFSDPYAPLKIIEGMNRFLEDEGIGKISDIIKTVKPW